MIGAFARKLGPRDRILACEETGAHAYAVKTRSDEGVDHARESLDAPPERFVERIPHEGGDVFLVPFLERLWHALRRRPEPEEAADQPAPTLSRPPQND